MAATQHDEQFRATAREQGKRMKWNGTGRGLKALGVSLAVALGMTACSRDYTLGYLYVTAARTALISAYSIDYQSGALLQLSDSPVPASDTTNANPVALVAAPNAKSLYVVNHDVSQVVLFAVGTDGKLFAQQTTSVVKNTAGTVIGSFPTAAAIDSTGNFLFVTFTFQNGFTTARPGPGGVAVFPIQHSNSDPSQEGLLGAPVVNTTVGTTAANPLPYFPIGFNPVGVFSNPKAGFVYVVDQDRTAAGAAAGMLLVFQYSATTGTLTPVAGPVASAASASVTGFSAGTTPAALAVDPTGRFIYVTDEATNQLYAYLETSSGIPTALNSSPFTTGQFPIGVTVDPRGAFVYVANFGSSTVSSFTIDQASGSLSGGTGSGVATGPTCVTIEPGLGIYLYTSNNLDSSVSAAQLDPHSGSLRQVQGTQFAAAALPTCATAIANGAHPTEIVD